MKKFMIIVMSLMLVLAMPTIALAETVDTAGNQVSSLSNISNQKIENDLIWCGDEASISSAQVAGDILAIGDNITINQSSVTGNIRAIASTLHVTATTVSRNITVAGEEVVLGQQSTAKSVYVYGDSVGFYGTTDCLKIAARDVVIDGVVNGDVDVTAQTVTVGPNAVISGTLNVESQTQPSVDSKAQIGDYLYLQSGTAGSFNFYDVNLASLGIVVIIAFVCMMALLSLVVAWLGRKEVERSAWLLKSKPASYLLWGLLVSVVAPIVATVLLLLIVTAPISIVIFFVICLLSIISTPFAAAGVGRLVFKNMNRLLSGVIVGVIFALLTCVPFVNIVVWIFSTLYTAGYAAKSLGLRFKGTSWQQLMDQNNGMPR